MKTLLRYKGVYLDVTYALKRDPTNRAKYIIEILDIEHEGTSFYEVFEDKENIEKLEALILEEIKESN